MLIRTQGSEDLCNKFQVTKTSQKVFFEPSPNYCRVTEGRINKITYCITLSTCINLFNIGQSQVPHQIKKTPEYVSVGS